MKLKNSLYISIGILGIGLFSLAHAQSVPVSITGVNIPGINSAAGANACSLVNSSNVNFPSLSSPVKILISPDGNNNGIRGPYSAIPPNCSQVPANAQSVCTALSAAFSAAVQAANAQSGFPQGTLLPPGSPTPDNSVVFIFSNNACGTRNGSAIPLCESTISFSGQTLALIDFNLNSLNNPSSSIEYTATQFENNSAFAACDIAHELTHTFGLADTYNSITTAPGIMGDECTPQLTSWSWDANAAVAVAWLNAGKPITVGDAIDCDYHCPSSTPVSSFVKSSNGSYAQTCSANSPSSVSSGAYTCNCDASSPYCIDLDTQQTITPPTGYCSDTSNSSSQTGESCVDDDGTNTCSPSSLVPPGEVCTCFEGTASCSIAGCDDPSDPSSCSAAVPSDFSCGSSDGSTPPDDDNYAQYACLSSACTYIGQGPDYSDPSCGGECSGD